MDLFTNKDFFILSKNNFCVYLRNSETSKLCLRQSVSQRNQAVSGVRPRYDFLPMQSLIWLKLHAQKGTVTSPRPCSISGPCRIMCFLDGNQSRRAIASHLCRPSAARLHLYKRMQIRAPLFPGRLFDGSTSLYFTLPIPRF